MTPLLIFVLLGYLNWRGCESMDTNARFSVRLYGSLLILLIILGYLIVRSIL